MSQDIAVAWVDNDGVADGLDIDGLFDAPPDPMLLGRLSGSDVRSRACWSIADSWLLRASVDVDADIPAWAWYGIAASAGYVV